MSYQQQCDLLAPLFNPKLYSCLTNNNVTFLPHFSMPSCIPVLPTTMLPSCLTFPCHAVFLSYQQQCYLLAPLFNPKLYSCLTNNNVTVLPHFSMPCFIPVLPTTMLPSCPTFQSQAVFLSYQQQCYCLAPLFHAKLYSCLTNNNVTFLSHFSVPSCIPVLPTTMLLSCPTFPCHAVFLSYHQQCYLLAPLFHAMLYLSLFNL